jgi:hypothetical protein
MNVGDKVKYDAPVSFMKTKEVEATVDTLPEDEAHMVGISYTMLYDDVEPYPIHVFRYVLREQVRPT